MALGLALAEKKPTKKKKNLYYLYYFIMSLIISMWTIFFFALLRTIWYGIKDACGTTTASMLQFNYIPVCLAGKFLVTEGLKFREVIWNLSVH